MVHGKWIMVMEEGVLKGRGRTAKAQAAKNEDGPEEKRG